MRRVAVLSTVLLALGLADTSSAQVCLGEPSLRDAHLQIGAGASLQNQERDYRLSASAGSDRLFARTALGVLDRHGVGTTPYELSGTLGLDKGFGRFHACPLASFAYIQGPTYFNASFRTITGSVGGSVGFVALDTPRLAIVPNVAAAFNDSHQRLEIQGPVYVPPAREPLMSPVYDCNPCQQYASAAVGVGLIFNNRTAVQFEATVYSGNAGDNRAVAVNVTRGFSFR